MDSTALRPIQFYATSDYPCNYLPGKKARSLVAAAQNSIDTAEYSALVAAGFRRSGTFVYKPYCHSCQACIPIRLPVAQFKANRSQRRNLKLFEHLRVTRHPLRWNEEHYQLYRLYQSQRHTGLEMDTDDKSQYTQFLLNSSIHSALYEFRDNDQLKMVALVDHLNTGLSAVYTFFDPYTSGLGTYGVLWQIDYCQHLKLDWLYLGYWIEQSPKMAYKTRFTPYQLYLDGDWVTPRTI